MTESLKEIRQRLGWFESRLENVKEEADAALAHVGEMEEALTAHIEAAEPEPIPAPEPEPEPTEPIETPSDTVHTVTSVAELEEALSGARKRAPKLYAKTVREMIFG